MLHSTEIDDVMRAIAMKLLPVSSKSSHPELWHIHSALSEWRLNFEWRYPNIGNDTSVEMGRTILMSLENVSDRDLAQKIEHLIRH